MLHCTFYIFCLLSKAQKKEIVTKPALKLNENLTLPIKKEERNVRNV